LTGVAELRGNLWERLDDKTELCGHPTSRTSCRTTCMTVLSYDKGWSTGNVLFSVLHDKVRFTVKTDAKHAATLLMLTMDESLLITIISLCTLRLRKKKYRRMCAYMQRLVCRLV
jgi:hypothetical protein